MTMLNDRQRSALELLRSNPERDLYEGAGGGGNRGSGEYWITYSADKAYLPLHWEDVRDLLEQGLLCDKWPAAHYKDRHGYSGMFVLTAKGRTA